MSLFPRSFTPRRSGRALALGLATASLLVPALAQAQDSGQKRIERKLVMIETSDEAPIREVSVDGSPVQVRRRSKARVFIEVDGNPKNDGQIDCRRDMRLVLSDGRILQDKVDICGDWKVTMNAEATLKRQADAGRSVRQAVPSTAAPSAPPRAGGVRRPAAGEGSGDLRGSRGDEEKTPAPATTAQERQEATGNRPQAADQLEADRRADERDQGTSADTFVAGPRGGLPNDSSLPSDGLALPVQSGKIWYVEDDGAEGWRLVYGVRETDDTALLATCRSRSNAVSLRLAPSGQPAADGAPLGVTLAARDVTRRYDARAVMDAQAGVAVPVVQLAASDPIFEGLARGNTLTVGIGGHWAYRISLSGSAGAVRRFQQACAPQAPREQDVAGVDTTYRQPSRPAPTDSYPDPSCADEGFVGSVASDRPSRLVILNERRRPVVVHWLDFDGYRRSQAEVPPGGRMVQDTLQGHPWLVSNLGGRCLGIYMARGASRTVTLRPGGGGGGGGRLPEAPLPPAPVAPRLSYPAPDGDTLQLSYDCDSGSYLDVTIDNARNVAIVRERGLSPVTLPDRSRDVDFDYAARGYRLSGGGGSVMWVRPGAAPQSCRIF